jgi:hypothetical protein
MIHPEPVREALRAAEALKGRNLNDLSNTELCVLALASYLESLSMPVDAEEALERVEGCARVVMTRRQREIQSDAETLARTVRAQAAEVAGLRAALERLGSMEAFTLSRVIDPERDAELLARVDFARASLKAKEQDKCTD